MYVSTGIGRVGRCVVVPEAVRSAGMVTWCMLKMGLGVRIRMRRGSWERGIRRVERAEQDAMNQTAPPPFHLPFFSIGPEVLAKDYHKDLHEPL